MNRVRCWDYDWKNLLPIANHTDAWNESKSRSVKRMSGEIWNPSRHNVAMENLRYGFIRSVIQTLTQSTLVLLTTWNLNPSTVLDITCRTGWPRSGKYFRKVDLVQYHLSSHVVVRARLQSRDSGATLRWDCEAFDSPFPSITSAPAHRSGRKW